MTEKKIKKSELAFTITGIKKILDDLSERVEKLENLQEEPKYQQGATNIETKQNPANVLENEKIINLKECKCKTKTIPIKTGISSVDLIKAFNRIHIEVKTEKQKIETFEDWKILFPKSFEKFRKWYEYDLNYNLVQSIWQSLDGILDYFDEKTGYCIRLYKSYDSQYGVAIHERYDQICEEIYHVSTFNSRKEAFEVGLFHLLDYYEKNL